MKWYRGFFRLWFALTVLWVSAWGAGVWYMQNENRKYDVRFAETRAELARQEALIQKYRDLGLVAADGIHGLRVVDSQPLRPFRDDLRVAQWLLWTVPGAFYLILRVSAWVFQGFCTTEEPKEQI